jgi:hypothetical protein
MKIRRSIPGKQSQKRKQPAKSKLPAETENTKPSETELSDEDLSHVAGGVGGRDVLRSVDMN